MAKDKKNANNIVDISKSKAKRLERQKEVAAAKRKKMISTTIGIGIVSVIALIVVWALGKQVYLMATRTTSITDYSAGLTEDGKIEGVDVMSAITLADYENIQIPAEEVKATAEEVDAEIESTLESYKELNEDTSLVIADGDVVNIDYVGTVDGVEFEGGNSNGEGYELTIGSNSFIDDFEQQLIGHKPGENVTVNVTFPEDYSSADVAGKDASFAVTIHGVMTKPELTDAFVAENFAETEGVSTAADYRAKVENDFYEQHLEEYLTKYIVDNSTVNSYPKNYLKNVKGIEKYNDEYMMEYYNQMFASYGMTYQNVWDIRGEEINDEFSYEMELNQRAKDTVKANLVYQAIYEKAGLTVEAEEAEAVETEVAPTTEVTETESATTDETSETAETEAAEDTMAGYNAQIDIQDAVIDYLMEMYK